jgi:DNA-binding winged helix-turn-helix (wHTH) protein/tetratricopeptide (TPR) repeat protein
MIYRFDHFEIDAEKFELRRAGSVCHVEPKVFDLIRFFAENPGRVIDRDEIIERVWEGRVVSDATVSSCIKSARKALDDSGSDQVYIRTVRGRGFTFLGRVRNDREDEEPAASRHEQAAQPTGQPSLVILRFQTFDDRTDLASIADGLVENLTTVLTRVPLLSIISRTSSFALDADTLSAGAVRRKLGVSYMLEGSLQRAAGRIRANVQLIETRNGFHLWAQAFDQMEDENVVTGLLHRVLPHLESQLTRAIFNDLRSASGDLSSRQLLIKAMGILSLKGWHRDSFTEAAGLLRQSIALEPDLALSHAYLALILGLGQRVGLLGRSEDDRSRAIDEAERALDLDPMDSNVLGLAGCALADVGQPERAIPLLRKAVDLNPNNAQAWAALGSASLVLHNFDTAIAHLERGIDLSPMDGRLAVWQAFIAAAHLQKGALDDALRTAERGCQSDDKTYIPRVLLMAALLQRGDRRQAGDALKECYRIKPDLSLREIACLVGPRLAAKTRQLRDD